MSEGRERGGEGRSRREKIPNAASAKTTHTHTHTHLVSAQVYSTLFYSFYSIYSLYMHVEID